MLDCTSGWWSEQVWSGVRVTEVLHEGIAPATNLAFVSVTGHRIVLPFADLDQAILATHVGGEPLSAGHGAPLRLVVPAVAATTGSSGWRASTRPERCIQSSNAMLADV